MSDKTYTMNPFDATPEEAPQPPEPAKPPEPQAPEGEAQPYLLGRKAADYDAAERGYINERLKDYLEILKKNPATQVFVKDIIHTDIELQRHDRMVEAEKKKYRGGKPTDDQTQWLLKMDNVRKGIMARHVASLENIGALPKDTMQTVQKDESLADVHARYMEELAERKKRGQRVGEPTVEAKELAAKLGMNPDRYQSTDVLSDQDREAIIAESQRGE